MSCPCPFPLLAFLFISLIPSSAHRCTVDVVHITPSWLMLCPTILNSQDPIPRPNYPSHRPAPGMPHHQSHASFASHSHPPGMRRAWEASLTRGALPPCPLLLTPTPLACAGPAKPARLGARRCRALCHMPHRLWQWLGRLLGRV
eukprot:1146956-Pelagomonas_calceolata.AAC.4